MTQQSSRAQRPDASAFPGPVYAWSAPGKPLEVRLPYALIDRLEGLAVENFRSIEARGSEIGGLLFGAADPNAPGRISIDDFEAIPCDYSRGPFYRLSDADLARFDEAVERRGGPAAAHVAGFFRSHSRKGLALDAEDMQVIDARFRDPERVVLLVRPFATKISAGGIFFWEDGRMRGESSYREFPFRSAELAASGGASNIPALDGTAEYFIPGPRPANRAAVVPMPTRLKLTRSSPSPSPSLSPSPSPSLQEAPPPAVPAAEIASPIITEPVKPPDPPPPAVEAPAPSLAAAAAELAPPPPARHFARKLVWAGVAAALAACSGALFLYPGLFRHAPKPPAALELRIEHTATDLLLTWNRDSDDPQRPKSGPLQPAPGRISRTHRARKASRLPRLDLLGQTHPRFR